MNLKGILQDKSESLKLWYFVMLYLYFHLLELFFLV